MHKKTLLYLLRACLALLIIANMAVIFLLSAEDDKESVATSDKVGTGVVGVVDKDLLPKDDDEWEIFSTEFLTKFRKFAHMAEFGTLGGLTFLFLLTWKNGMYCKYLISVVFAGLYAVSDEIHQYFVPGRTCSPLDMLLDTAGALILCTLILAVCFFVRRETQPTRTTTYRLPSPVGYGLTIAVASDLHGNDPTEALEHLRAASPDLILIPGDLMDDKALRDPNASGYTFLSECAEIAPTFYSIGNHELACYHKGNPWRHPTPLPLTEEIRERIAATGATLLENESTVWNGIAICALSSGINGAENKPNTDTLEAFEELSEARILLCHHPEYFVPYIKDTTIELTVSGHAHGGHWRFFGQGVYAPGQGLFPKYTAGVIEERCVISRGLGDHTRIPRICNRPELVVIEWD